MRVLLLQQVSSCVSGFPLLSPCQWGKLTIFHFQRCQSVKIGGGLAGHARFDAQACLVSGLWFSPGFAVLCMGEGVKAVCHVILRGKRGTS